MSPVMNITDAPEGGDSQVKPRDGQAVRLEHNAYRHFNIGQLYKNIKVSESI